MTQLEKSEEALVNELAALIEQSKQQVVPHANSVLTLLFWQIGSRMNNEILQNKRATYGKQIVSTVSTQLENTDFQKNAIGQSSTDQLGTIDFQKDGIHQSVTDELGKDQDARFEEDDRQLIAPEKILSKLSYTHIVHLIPIHDIAKRAFYEQECIRQAWSEGTGNIYPTLK